MCSALTTVTGLDAVTSIGNNTFYGCTSFINVYIGSIITWIGYAAFANAASDTIHMTQSVFNATVNPPDPAWYGSYTLAFNGGGGGAPCFLGSARVLTTQGYKRFDSLNLDDTIQTADSRAVAIKAIRKTPVTPSTSNNPYLIPVGSFGATEEILVSPRHRIFVNGMAHEARNLGLEQQDMTSAWVYYNIELPNWNTDNMIVGGVEVKSLAPVRHAVMTIEQFCRVAARQFGKSVLEPKMLCKSCFKIAFSTVIKWKQIS